MSWCGSCYVGYRRRDGDRTGNQRSAGRGSRCSAVLNRRSTRYLLFATLSCGGRHFTSTSALSTVELNLAYVHQLVRDAVTISWSVASTFFHLFSDFSPYTRKSHANLISM